MSPGEETFERVRDLLREAYDRAVLRATRKEASELMDLEDEERNG